jgi:hypothetical protein
MFYANCTNEREGGFSGALPRRRYGNLRDTNHQPSQPGPKLSKHFSEKKIVCLCFKERAARSENVALPGSGGRAATRPYQSRRNHSVILFKTLLAPTHGVNLYNQMQTKANWSDG